MKIEQQERSTKRKASANLVESFEETTLNKVKEKARIKLTRIEDMYRGDPEIYTKIREFDPGSG